MIGIGQTIIDRVSLPGQTGGGTPPVETFNILAENGDTLTNEGNPSLLPLVTEVAP